MPRVDAGMATSGLEVPSCRAVRNFGMMRGIIVRSRSVIGNLGAALQTIVGRNILAYSRPSRLSAFRSEYRVHSRRAMHQ
jgi:uncharacterized protein YbjQ (UPF0145 family)